MTMDRETFELICGGLRSVISDSRSLCREMSAKRRADDDYVERVKPEAKRLLSKLTVFLQTDLYHILAMGRLTAAQTARLIKLTREASQIKKRVWKAAEYGKGDQIAKARDTHPTYACHSVDGVVLSGTVPKSVYRNP